MKLRTYLNGILLIFLFSSCSTNLPVRTARNAEILNGVVSNNVSQLPTSATTEGQKNSAKVSSEDLKPNPMSESDKNSAEAIQPKTEVASKDNSESIKRMTETDLNSSDMQKFAFELGFDVKKNLTEAQKTQILERKHLRELERALDSQKERLQYSKVLPWLKSDAEKIELLSIPGIEGRQVWINKNKIWSRAKSLKEFDEVVESQDIALGMPAEYVKKSWGEPESVEVSGNPIYRNERWKYSRQVSTPQGYKQEKRLVYFEGGRVVGWETE